MPNPIYGLQRGELHVELAYAVGDVLAEGTADSGSSSTLVHNQLVDADDSRLKGRPIYIYKGVGNGDIRRILSFTAGSDTIAPTPNFTATIDSTSQYLVTQLWHPNDYIRAIRRAQRMIGGNLSFKEEVDRSIVIGSPLANGTFWRWTNGTASAPDSWTLAGTSAAIAQETTLVRVGRYAAKMTSGGGALSTLTQSLSNVGRFRGQSLSAKVWVWNNTASEVSIKLDYGADSKTASNAGSSNWEFLETDSLLMPDNSTKIDIVLTTATGSKVGYFAGCHVPADLDNEYLIDSDAAFVWIDGPLGLSRPIPTGNGVGGDIFENAIGPESWRINPESTRKLVLNTNDVLRSSILSIRGFANHADLTAATTAWTGNPEALLARAQYYLYQMKMADDPGRWRDLLLGSRADAEALETRYAISMTAPKRVEWN